MNQETFCNIFVQFRNNFISALQVTFIALSIFDMMINCFAYTWQASASVSIAFVRRNTPAVEIEKILPHSGGTEGEPTQPLGMWKRLEDSIHRESELAASLERQKKEISSLSTQLEVALEQSEKHLGCSKNYMSRCQDMEGVCASLVRELIRIKVQSNRLHDALLQSSVSRTGTIGLTVEKSRIPGAASETELRVARIFEGGAAWNSKKIAIGDILISVDGISVSHISKDEVQNMFAGPIATPILLKLRSTTTNSEYIVVLERTSLDGNALPSEEMFEKSFRAVRLLRDRNAGHNLSSEISSPDIDGASNDSNITTELKEPSEEFHQLKSEIANLQSAIGATERDKANLARQLSTALEQLAARNEDISMPTLVTNKVAKVKPGDDDSESVIDAAAMARKLECAELAWFNAEEELSRARAAFEIASEEARSRLAEAKRQNMEQAFTRITSTFASSGGDAKLHPGHETYLQQELKAARASIAAAERDRAGLARQLSQALEKLSAINVPRKDYIHGTPLFTGCLDIDVLTKDLQMIAAAKGIDESLLRQQVIEITADYFSKIARARRELADREKDFSSRLFTNPPQVVLFFHLPSYA
jgi:hypothetical protein